MAQLSQLIGTVAEEEYDKVQPTPTGLPELASECRAIITRYATPGAPLWTPVPSSAYATLLDGTATLPLCAVTWDV